jgi:hypothetical protein
VIAYEGDGGYVLDFDCECLPGHWIGGDFVSKVLTAVAWCWIGEGDEPTVMTHYDSTPEKMAIELSYAIESATLVTGHYIRGFDLPLLNGNLLRTGLPPMRRVMTQDTKLDLKKSHGRSLSQRNLGSQLGIAAPKVDVTLPEWEGFNTREPGFRDKGIERVRGDVIQHMELRAKLLEYGWLGPARGWDGKPSKSAGYRG